MKTRESIAAARRRAWRYSRTLAARAHAQTPISTCGTTITEPGSYRFGFGFGFDVWCPDLLVGNIAQSAHLDGSGCQSFDNLFRRFALVVCSLE